MVFFKKVKTYGLVKDTPNLLIKIENPEIIAVEKTKSNPLVRILLFEGGRRPIRELIYPKFI